MEVYSFKKGMKCKHLYFVSKLGCDVCVFFGTDNANQLVYEIEVETKTRKCKECNCILNRYNKDVYCYLHKKLVMGLCDVCKTPFERLPADLRVCSNDECFRIILKKMRQ